MFIFSMILQPYSIGQNISTGFFSQVAVSSLHTNQKLMKELSLAPIAFKSAI